MPFLQRTKLFQKYGYTQKHCVIIHQKDFITKKKVVLASRGIEYTDDKKYFIKDFQLYMIDKIMNKSFHCLRVGLKKTCKDDITDEQIIRSFKLDRIRGRGRWVPKAEIDMNQLMDTEEANKKFVFKKVATYN